MKTFTLALLTLAFGFVIYPCHAAPKSSDPKEDEAKGGTGLVAHYYRDAANWNGKWPKNGVPKVSASGFTFTEYAYSRVEPLVNHLFIKRGWFSVRWKGVLTTSKTPEKDVEAEYTFHIWADDGCRLIIDGKTVINSWIPAWEKAPESHRKAKVTLKPGAHQIVIEYFQGPSLKKKDHDPIKVYWECPAQKMKKSIIPASHFSHSAADTLPSKGAKSK
jgi:hypothetical protein